MNFWLKKKIEAKIKKDNKKARYANEITNSDIYRRIRKYAITKDIILSIHDYSLFYNHLLNHKFKNNSLFLLKKISSQKGNPSFFWSLKSWFPQSHFVDFKVNFDGWTITTKATTSNESFFNPYLLHSTSH